MENYNTDSTDAMQHAGHISGKLDELIEHLRSDIEKVSDDKAKALFETSAEVLVGLKKAFTDYKEKTEKAWH